MNITYNDALDSDFDKVRFYIQDTTSDSGPKPDKENFSDQEITGLINAEGSWQKAIAAAFEVLEAAWSSYADLKVGPQSESFSQIAKKYAERAARWRKDYGSTATTRAGTRHPTRIDGYSDDIASNE